MCSRSMWTRDTASSKPRSRCSTIPRYSQRPVAHLGYDVFTYGDMTSFAGLTLVTVQPSHAILTGVAGMNGDINLGDMSG